MKKEITIGKMDKLIIHFAGNKNNSDGIKLSDDLTDFTEVEEYFNRLIAKNFKSEEMYRFHFEPELTLNPMFQFIGAVFQNNNTFTEQSKHMCRYLYDNSMHPQIKGGELCVFLIKDCQINEDTVDCIGLFKSESKDTVLKIDGKKGGYKLSDIEGMNTHKLDKGCLIFNTEKEDGYLISVVDNTNKNSEARYWTDDFLSIQPKKDEYHHTSRFLDITKQFVTNQLTQDFDISKPEQIDLLNRSVDFFKKHDTFDKEEFEEEVFADNNVIESFRKFDKNYRDENEIDIEDSFTISAQAVKKQARIFKSVLKLDKNFHIYIHGNRELIQQGTDENGRKFYKIYYEEET